MCWCWPYAPPSGSGSPPASSRRRRAGSAPSSSHPCPGALLQQIYISSYFNLMDYEKKRLAVDLMKERSPDPDKEIENLDALLNLLSSEDACSDQHKMQAAAARKAIQDKKLELISLLLRADGGKEYTKKMEELAAVARRHRESLVLGDLKAKSERLEEHQAKLIAGIVLWGLPLTLITFAQWH